MKHTLFICLLIATIIGLTVCNAPPFKEGEGGGGGGGGGNGCYWTGCFNPWPKCNAQFYEADIKRCGFPNMKKRLCCPA